MEDETRKAIHELVNRSWIADKETLILTEEGRRVREQAEDLTNKYFFSPWSVLTDIEYNQLCGLLQQLNANLAK